MGTLGTHCARELCENSDLRKREKINFTLDDKGKIGYCPDTFHRGIEQLAARQAHNLEVAGSSPAPATKQKLLYTQEFLVSEKRVIRKTVYHFLTKTGIMIKERRLGE